MASPYRGRFAPSPTGAMHLGNARTALLAWLDARASGGTLVLRVEDLDPPRVVAGAEARILDELRWLGLDWDEGPFRQSERAARYDEAAQTLLERGAAFECACSRAEVARSASAPHAGDEAPRYPGTCRDLAPGEAAARARAAGREPVLRFHGKGARVTFVDRVRGECDPLGEAGADDFVIRRADGIAAYQLAVVVDDAAMGITHVVRADDLLDSTPRQIALFRALDLPVPSFAHVPLVLAPGGERLAKRNRPAALGDLRAAGAGARAVAGALAASAGVVPPGTIASPREMLASFDLARLNRLAVELDASALGAGGAPAIREARGSDAIPLAEVYVASWRGAYREIVPERVLETLSVAAQTARWQKLLAGASRKGVRAFLAEKDGAVLGFIVAGDARGDLPDPRRREVWAMYVAPPAFRHGIGRALVAHAEADARATGAQVMLLWILSANSAARAFCEAVGYNPTGETRANAVGGEPVEETKFIHVLQES